MDGVLLMTKVLYSGKIIELVDELEEGFAELDLLNPRKTLEDTIELENINLDKYNNGDTYE